MMKMKMYMVAGALAGLVIPSFAFAQAGAGTGAGTGGAGTHGLGAFKPLVLEVNPGTPNDLARTKVVNGIVPDYDHDGVPGEVQLDEDLNGNSILDPGEDTNGNPDSHLWALTPAISGVKPRSG